MASIAHRGNVTVTDGWLATPLDFNDPTGETTQVRFRVRFADVQPAPQGALFVHPGGPGNDRKMGMTLAANYNLQNPEIFQNFDVFTVDQRGVGDSIPPKAPSGSTNIFQQTGMTCFPNNMSESALREALQRTYELRVKEYYDPMYIMPSSKNYREYAGTLNLVHDLELFRKSIGLERISLYVQSYGTQIGGTYVSLFPDRVHRAIFSGAVTPTNHVEDFAVGGGAAMVESLSYILQLLKVQMATNTDAVLQYMGPDPPALVEQLFADMDNGNAAYPGKGRLSASPLLWFTILQNGFAEVYKAHSTLIELTYLANYKKTGIMTPGALDSGEVQCTYAGGPITAILGLDVFGFLSEDDVVRIANRVGRNSGFGGRAGALTWLLFLYGRGLAKIPPSQPIGALGNVDVPVLVMDSMFDAATTYQWSSQMHAAFPAGMLLSWQGAGHGLSTTNALYAVQDMQRCQDKIAIYLRTGSLTEVRASPVCDTKLVPDLTQADTWKNYSGYYSP